LVLALILAMVGQELALRGRARREGRRVDYRPYGAALGLIAAAGVCSALDVTRVFCDPNDHWLQGHALWHLLSAASLLALYHFYARLAEDPQGRTV
jgi:hypothetical protein